MKKFLFLFALLVGQLLTAGTIPAINIQPIHEAFVLKITDPIPQEIITKQAPAPIVETPPPQPNAQTIWIPGYWAWVREKQDFTWVCGVWRLPPPDQIWSTGYWKDVSGGWTWVKGAWMPNPTKGQWVYGKTPPPAAQNEDTGSAPGADYFWLPGYWNYTAGSGQYQWLSGSWQKFDPKWIVEAAHWIWRPEGYLFVPTYWDWTLDTRGIAYDCKNRTPLEPKAIAMQLTCCFPDYIGECSHYWYYQPQFWADCGCTPPWWGWSGWWSLPWGDQWWLWWWWVNPGFPAPPFLPIDMIDIFPGPSIIIIDMFGGLPLPLFITPFGVPTLELWIEAINSALGGNNGLTPFLPLNNQTIIDYIGKQTPKGDTKRPGGKGDGKPLHKPNSGHVPSSGSASLPSIPNVMIPIGGGSIAPVPPTPNATAPTTPNVDNSGSQGGGTYYPPSTTYTPPPTTYYPPTVVYPGGGDGIWDGGGYGWGHRDDGHRDHGHRGDGHRGDGHRGGGKGEGSRTDPGHRGDGHRGDGNRGGGKGEGSRTDPGHHGGGKDGGSRSNQGHHKK